VVGVVLILLALFVLGPFAVFVGGGAWSAAMGWLFPATDQESASEA
jgi:hypothetical protein